MKKTIMCLIDGVRFDALFKIHEWIGLPTIFKFINEGCLFTNVYTYEPVLTNLCVGKILTGSTDYAHSNSVFTKLSERNIPNASVGGDMFLSRGATAVFDNLMAMDFNYTPDQIRADIASEIITDYDFIYIYFVGSDKYAHVCRDAGRHIYSYDSPYIKSIVYEENCIKQIYDKVIELGITDYNFILLADHGMTDDGRHSIVNWTHEAVMHVPVIAYGSDFKSNYKENNRFYTTDVIHGIISLYDNNYQGRIFDNAKK
jgi:predicted AlkP superfamily pyrophosphatase or phosphodiesterase